MLNICVVAPRVCGTQVTQQATCTCCLTYTVDTTDFAGSIQAVSSVMLFLKQTDSGLKAESMISY